MVLDNPHIVKIYEFFECPKYIYIILESVSGKDLLDIVFDNHHLNEI